MAYIKKFIMLLLSASLFLCGCNKNEELSTFEENIKAFNENINKIDNSMGSIDPTSPEAVTMVNTHLEEMLQQFQVLADMEIPPQFASIDILADDALEYMQEATRLYSEAYQGDSVSDSFIQAASENYESAMKRIGYIATILQGDIPEGAKILEGDDTEFEPYTE